MKHVKYATGVLCVLSLMLLVVPALATVSPSITSISPSSVASGTRNVYATVEGTDFIPGAGSTTVVQLTTGAKRITASNVIVSSSTTISCRFNLLNAPAGAWNVVVTNPDGGIGMLANAFTIKLPTVTSITPGSATSGNTSVSVTIKGTDFITGAGSTTVVQLTKGAKRITASNVIVSSPTTITCRFNLLNAPTGVWNVVVTNPGGGSGTLVNGFTINP